MKSTGAPVVPGVVSTWAAHQDPVSVEVDLAEVFAAPTPLDVVFGFWRDQGVLVHRDDDENPNVVSQALGLLTTATGVWSHVPPPDTLRVRCTDPVAGRHWLYSHRWSDMIMRMLPRVADMGRDAGDPTSIDYSFDTGSGVWQRWAAGQSWADFTAEAPAVLVEQVERARVEAIVMLQQWQKYPFPVRMESIRDWPCEGEMVQRVLGMIFGPHPDSVRMTLERALLYAAAGFGVGDARSTEFGVDTPSDEVLKTLVALGVG